MAESTRYVTHNLIRAVTGHRLEGTAESRVRRRVIPTWRSRALCERRAHAHDEEHIEQSVEHGLLSGCGVAQFAGDQRHARAWGKWAGWA
jgi:hypothetical protein